MKNKQLLMRHVLCLCIMCAGISFLHAQKGEVLLKTPRTLKNSPEPVKAKQETKSPRLESTNICHECTWDMEKLEDVQKLKAEIEAHALKEDYDWRSKLKVIYSSPLVIQTHMMDPTFPIIFTTGDKSADLQAYNQAKKEWVQQYPERYRALKKR